MNTFFLSSFAINFVSYCGPDFSDGNSKSDCIYRVFVMHSLRRAIELGLSSSVTNFSSSSSSSVSPLNSSTMSDACCSFFIAEIRSIKRAAADPHAAKAKMLCTRPLCTLGLFVQRALRCWLLLLPGLGTASERDKERQLQSAP